MLGDVVVVDHTAVYLGIGAAFFGMLGLVLPAYFASRRAARIERKVDTGNDKDIGLTVHDLAVTVNDAIHEMKGQLETVIAQNHTNTQEIVHLSDRFTAHLEEIAADREEYKAVLPVIKRLAVGGREKAS